MDGLISTGANGSCSFLSFRRCRMARMDLILNAKDETHGHVSRRVLNSGVVVASLFERPRESISLSTTGVITALDSHSNDWWASGWVAQVLQLQIDLYRLANEVKIVKLMLLIDRFSTQIIDGICMEIVPQKTTQYGNIAESCQ